MSIRWRAWFFSTLAILIGFSETGRAQSVGHNINVISGIQDQFRGDLFLQKQNEPCITALPRNPDHLFAAANDYRTVDFAGLDVPPSKDAWMGVYRSYNRGRTWAGGLLPGYLQDTSPAGRASPLFGLTAAADPVCVADTTGQVYLGGLAFDRGGASTMFVAVYEDRNDLEGGDTFRYLRTVVIDVGSFSSIGEFVDKPAIAVDIPHTPCGNVYFAYAIFDGQDKNGVFRSKVMFSRSTDCGLTWSRPFKLNNTFNRNQGTAIGIDPRDGTVYVFWRTLLEENGIVMVKSTNGGVSFTDPVPISISPPFDQSTSFDQPTIKMPGTPTFRSNGFPTVALDKDGKLYVAWQERVGTNGSPLATGSPRIVLTTGTPGGISWTERKAVTDVPTTGPQVMPALSAGGGLLRLLYYQADGEVSANGFISGIDRNLKVFVAEANLSLPPASNPVFGAPVQVSTPGVQNRGNLPMYCKGACPFMGDYIGLAPAVQFVRGSPWRWALEPTDIAARSSHAIWTDNRDVILPADGAWTNYSPPGTGVVSCVNPGSRNANIYTAEISPGLVAGSPQPFFRFVNANGALIRDANGNPIKHTYVLYVENRTGSSVFVRLTIKDNEPGLDGSFRQCPDPTVTCNDLDSLDREILAGSRITLSVYVTCTGCSLSNPAAPFSVDVQQIDKLGPSGTVIPGGLSASVSFNADPTNPPNAQVSNNEIHNPSLQDPSLQDPSLQDPSLQDPSIQDPSIQNDIVSTAVNDGNISSGYRNFTHLVNGATLRSQGYQFRLLINRRYSIPGVVGCTTVEVPRNQTISNILSPSLQDPSIQDPSLQDPSLQDPSIQDPSLQDPSIQNSAYFVAPASSAPSSHDGTTHAPRFADAAVIVLRIHRPCVGVNGELVPCAPGAGPPFGPVIPANAIAQGVVAQAANTGQTTPSADFFDNTPPDIIPTINPPPNAAGWNKTDVTVSWSVTDLGSGIASKSGCDTQMLTDETAGTVLTCSATNRAGLSGSVSVTIKIDKTPPNPPTATVSPTPNAAGWNNVVPVNVSFAGNGDVGLVQSGVASCTGSTSFNSETAGTDVNGTCTDVAGNASAITKVTVRIDLTPPNPPTASLTPTPNAAGWNNTTPVTVNWVSNGDVGPVQSGVASCTSPSSFTNETAGTPVSGTCTDVAGNPSTATLVTVRIDKTPPTITITSPLNNGNYLLGAPEPANYSCADTLSGVPPGTGPGTSCAGPVPNGSNFDTSTFGPKTFTVNATDVAGNTASLTRNYTVFAQFIGFLSPLVAAGSESSPTFAGTFNLGKAIPIKWQLKNSAGAFITGLSSVTKIEAVFNPDCAGPAEGTAILLYSPTMGATGNSILRYVNKDNQFVFNWDTSSTVGLGAGCWNTRVWIYNAAPRVTIVQETP